jgi:serpin B
VTDRAHLAFALSLHRAAAPDPRVDACWSPYSVASALGLAAQAAAGETREEIVRLLGEGGDELLRSSTVTDDADFAVANTLWTREGLEVEAEFLDALGRWPGAKVRTAPFADDPEGARKLVNADVAETTRDLIPELLEPGSVAPDTAASIVNAVYLKAGWLNAFADGGTEPRPFHAPGGTVDVPTMTLTARLRHAAADGWQAITLPALGGVEAVVLLPDGELDESTLDADRLTALLDARTTSHIALFTPELALRARFALKEALAELGVRTVFTRDADLSGLSPDPDLLVDDVLHEAVLRVDEQGFEGAAATAVMIRAVSFVVETDPVEIHVDRPHLLLVRHARTGVLYFLARVVQPG